MIKWDVFEAHSGQVQRGLDDEQIRRGLEDGAITSDDFVRPSAGGRYQRLGDVPELADLEPGRRRSRRRTSEFGEGADLTPMVDVTFQLLLFFMLTATYTMQSTIGVPRPDTAPTGARQALPTLDELTQDNVVVTIKADNSIWLDDAAVPPAGLARAIRAARRGSGHSELIVSADPDAFHETVVRVLDAANEAGMQRIRMANPSESLE